MLGLVLHRFIKLAITIASVIIFILSSLSIVGYQFIANIVWKDEVVRRQTHLDRSKKIFILLLVTILRIVAPSRIRITTENKSIAKGTFMRDVQTGGITSKLARNSVIISNHQIYTDWVFLWWLTYTGNLAGNVYIMLKKSLESIPIMGYGMKNYKFIFMNRRWEKDKVNMANRFEEMDLNARGIGSLAQKTNSEISQIHWPYSLILFPEGTNLSANTRSKSDFYAEKINRTFLKNVLLPRITGLRFSLLCLRESCEVVYDATIGYSGVKKDEYGQDIYRLGNIFLRGQAPKIVDIHLRAFKLSEIPIDDDEMFTEWLFRVWREKDELLDTFYAKGSFDLDPDLNHTVVGWCTIKTSEMLLIVTLPLLLAFMVVYSISKHFLRIFT
ncbi:LAMI_0H07866g1_1 [Lachancea mirantina]|uniref:LAMI_0H07866g1_1 n=1 Tax=Lachancea mirantina TaxID=1230905 RepID=A0A1G4KFY8_9SACH|nr:LAMI_0H07866g1_1 [Lachancea mirantina]